MVTNGLKSQNIFLAGMLEAFGMLNIMARSSNSVKNHWYSTLRKQTRTLVKYVSEKVVRTEMDWKCVGWA